MRAVLGRWDFVASGVFFAIYHLQQPWSMPATLIDWIVNQAYATRRFQSTWMGQLRASSSSVSLVLPRFDGHLKTGILAPMESA